MRSTNWIDLTLMLTRWIIVFLQYQHIRHWTRSIWNSCCETLDIIASSFSSCLHADLRWTLDSRSCITHHSPLTVAILYIAVVWRDVRQSYMLIIWGHALSVHIAGICFTDRPFYELMSIFCWQISQWTIYQSNFWIDSDFHCFFAINWPFLDWQWCPLIVFLM